MNFEDASKTAARILELDRQIAGLEVERKRLVADVSANTDAAAGQLSLERDGLWEPFRVWVDEHQTALTAGGTRKTFKFPEVRLEFRVGAKKVEVEDDDAAVQTLAHQGLAHFLAVDRKKVAKSPDAVLRLGCGVSVVRAPDIVRLSELHSDAPDPRPEGVK